MKACRSGSRRIRLGMVAKSASNTSSLMKSEVQLNGKAVSFLFDSGAEANVVDESTWIAIGTWQPTHVYRGRKCFNGTIVSFKPSIIFFWRQATRKRLNLVTLSCVPKAKAKFIEQTANNPVTKYLHKKPSKKDPWQEIRVDFAGPIRGKGYLTVR